MSIRLIIFDMDGTLIDSEGAIGQAAQASLREYGISPELHEFLEFTGQGDDKFIGGVAAKHGLTYTTDMKKLAYSIYMAHPERVTVFPWSQKTVKTAVEKGLSAVVASASDREKVHFNLSCIGLSPDDFTAVISATDVTRQKPDPEIFLLAAERAGISPEDAVVCEDSISGVMAGRAAGMTVIGITTGYSAEELIRAGANYIVDDLTKIFEVLHL